MWCSNISVKSIFFNHRGEVCKHLLIVAYRSTSNLRDILVKAKLPTITTSNNTCLSHFAVDSDCATYPYITNGLTQYSVDKTNI